MSEQNVDFQKIEDIRIRLALSRRQICLLMKMDPSAWSRWEKSETGVPAHVFQSLSWYLQLVEQSPEVHMPHELEQKLNSRTKEYESRITQLKKEVDKIKELRTQEAPKNEPILQGLKDSFESVLLKYRDENSKSKALELESLKYDNQKLKDNILKLQSFIESLNTKLIKLQESYSKSKSTISTSKPKKKISFQKSKRKVNKVKVTVKSNKAKLKKKSKVKKPTKAIRKKRSKKK